MTLTFSTGNPNILVDINLELQKQSWRPFFHYWSDSKMQNSGLERRNFIVLLKCVSSNLIWIAHMKNHLRPSLHPNWIWSCNWICPSALPSAMVFGGRISLLDGTKHKTYNGNHQNRQKHELNQVQTLRLFLVVTKTRLYLKSCNNKMK